MGIAPTMMKSMMIQNTIVMTVMKRKKLNLQILKRCASWIKMYVYILR